MLATRGTIVCCGTTSLSPSSAEIVVPPLRFIANPPLPSRVPDHRALPTWPDHPRTVARTECEAFVGGSHSDLRLSFPGRKISSRRRLDLDECCSVRCGDVDA